MRRHGGRDDAHLVDIRLALRGADGGRMADMGRVEAPAVDAKFHFFFALGSSIFGFCSLRL